VGLTIYLARHAEAANPREILYGRLPRVDLSLRGREQATVLAAAMADLPLEAIYQSPLLRARRTASAIASHHPGVPIITSSLLLENLHPYQGRPQAEVAKLADRAYDRDVLGADGESIVDLRDRMARFLRRAAARHPGGVVAAIGHADPLAALRAYLLGKELTTASLRQEAPQLAAVFRVELGSDGSARLDWFWRPAPPPSAAQASPGPTTNGPSGPVERISGGTISRAGLIAPQEKTA
jgi:broad specificity phosphatase PhoE